ncbi:hypothetical protein BDN72DRAFT_732656, partial [Pluteus cervinus]
IYACFVLPAAVEYTNGRPYLGFHCFAKGCKVIVRRYLDKKDKGSTSNLHEHAKSCWGEDVAKRVKDARDVGVARDKIIAPYKLNGKITSSFERKTEKETYSHTQFTRTETKYVPIHESFNCGFKRLMKTGRPAYYLPSASTVSRDVKRIFTRTQGRIAKMLQESGQVSFQIDAWTSPNHKAYVGITASFEVAGEIMTIVLDIVEVAKSHSGVNLAAAF